jgi:ABC-type dipeptide/oligopeptide/nickel transport system permease subunit
MWLIKSAKGRILGVDTLGQQVPSRVWYGMACLLIRNTIGCVSRSAVWGLAWYFTQAHGARGAFVGKP